MTDWRKEAEKACEAIGLDQDTDYLPRALKALKAADELVILATGLALTHDPSPGFWGELNKALAAYRKALE